MFQAYTIPLEIDTEKVSIKIQSNLNMFSYYRKIEQEEIIKKLVTEKHKLIIQPVEPLNYPKPITQFMLIELENSLSIAPKSKSAIFITFPLEIGVFLPAGKEYEIFDVFSLTKTKFTLYGDPATGIICKYWKSTIFDSIPTVDPLKFGLIKLTILNLSENWQEVRKVVFKAVGMKLFYDEKLVAMQATMKVHDDVNAEVVINENPLSKNMKKAIEIYTANRLSLKQSKSYMFEGI